LPIPVLSILVCEIKWEHEKVFPPSLSLSLSDSENENLFSIPEQGKKGAYFLPEKQQLN